MCILVYCCCQEPIHILQLHTAKLAHHPGINVVCMMLQELTLSLDLQVTGLFHHMLSALW